MVSVKASSVIITISCFLGLGLSIYAFIVEQAAEKNADYRAYCDINEYMSCSAVFKTEYGKGFGIFGKLLGEDSFLNKPNSLAGMLFYSLLIVFAQSNRKPLAFLTLMLSAASVLLSVYLACLLIFVIHSVCIVCVGTYLVNVINLLCSYSKFKKLNLPAPIKSKKKRA